MAAVVLAAGEGARFTASGGAGHKLLARHRGRPVAEWAILAAASAGLAATYVVHGDVEPPVPADAPGPVTLVPNPRWREGIATSLQAGIAAAGDDGFDAVVVGLADQPLVSREAWVALAEASDVPIAVATYGGRRGNPVRLSAAVWPLLPSTGDEGARGLVRRRPDLVVEIPCPGEPHDIDTLSDLERLELIEWS